MRAALIVVAHLMALVLTPGAGQSSPALGLARTAFASPTVEVIPAAPRFEVHIDAPLEEPVLLHRREPGTAEIPAVEVRHLRDDRPVALVLVINTQSAVLAADGWEEESGPGCEGYRRELATALDRLDLAHTLPAGSAVAVIGYDSTAELMTPGFVALSPSPSPGTEPGPLATLFASDATFIQTSGNDLVAGMQLAVEQLDTMRQPRKLVVVIGDGTAAGSSDEAAPLLRANIQRAGIEVGAVLIRNCTSPQGDGILADLLPNARHASPTTLADELAHQVDVVHHRTVAGFDTAALPHDGRVHDYMLFANGHPIVSPAVPTEYPPPPSKLWRWLVVAGATLAFALLSAWMFRPSKTS